MRRRRVGLVEGLLTLGQLFVAWMVVGIGFAAAAAILRGLAG